jgi:trans-L-3-hydroxyproline dehydratase
VAQLYLRGEIGRDDVLVNESIIGTVFRARVVGETQLGEFAAVIPEIEGSAYVCGFANWIIDERDPLKYGFLVR